MLTFARETFGAAVNLHIAGPAQEIAPMVSKLYNFGVISNIPDNYDETQDTRVMVQSDPARLHKGYLGMAMVELQNDKALMKSLKGKPDGLLPYAEIRAREMLDVYTNHGNFYTASNGRDFPTSALRVAPRHTAE